MKAIQSFRKTSFRAILISVLMSLALPLAPAKGAEYTRTPENRVIYEVFVRNFSPEGNFKGVEQQIPRLKELGIDVIWLMPIYLLGEEGKWGTYSSPYAIRNYKEIDPANGSAADLHSLINTIHQAGMEVWFDWVGNHTSKDNVWVSTHPEYYGYNFYSPNGWNDVYQLDVNCAAMHDAMIDAMQYWVDEFDIDGYRCDFASGPSEEFWSKATSRVLKNGKRIAWLAEDNLKPELVSKGYFDYNYAFEFYYDGLKRFADGGSLSGLRDACRALHSNSAYMGRSRMVYTSNHDIVQDLGGTEDRHLHKYLKPLTVLQFTVYGMPLLYNGQEIQYKSGAVSLAEKTPIDWSNPDNSMTDLYRTLISLKHTHPSLQTGLKSETMTNLSTSNDDKVYAYMRGQGENAVVVLLNFGDAETTFSVNGLPAGAFKDVFSGRTADFSSDNTFTLPAQGYAVYTLGDGGEVTPRESRCIYIANRMGSSKAPASDDNQFLKINNKTDMKKLFTVLAAGAIAAGSFNADAYNVFVNNLTGWSEPHLYAWGADASAEIFGAWPGAAPSGTATVDGMTYDKFECPASADGLSVNLIYNGGGSKCKDYTVTLDKDYYFVAVGSNLIPADEYTGEEPVGNILYVNNRSSWSTLNIYAWASGEPELFGGWPGASSFGTTTIAGETFLKYQMEAVTGDYNLIINNGTDQFDGPTINSGADVYLLVEDGKATVIPNPGVDTYNLYVENNTGWADFYVYAWSESEPELFGAWPGVKGEATATVDGKTCFVFPFEGNGKAYNLIFNNNDGNQYDVTQITLDKNYYFIANADGFKTAVETIEAEDAETPVYFNLQGMKVEKPENGVFIKVTGGKSEKVLF